MRARRHIIRSLLAAVVVCGAMPTLTATAATRPEGTTVLNACQRLSTGYVRDGNYTVSAVYNVFEITDDIDLSPMIATGGPSWARGDLSGRYGTSYSQAHSYLALNCRGDLQFWHSPTVMLWHTGTSGSGAAHLIVNNKGELLLYSSDWSRIVWRSWSGQRYLATGSVLPSGGRLVSGGDDHHNYLLRTLIMQHDGNLEYRVGGVLRWQTNTHVVGAHAALNTRAQLVVISPIGRLLWSSRNTGSRVSALDVEFLRINDYSNIYIGSRTIWQAPGVY